MQAAAGLEIRALTVKGDYEKAIQKLVDVSVNFKTPAKTVRAQCLSTKFLFKNEH